MTRAPTKILLISGEIESGKTTTLTKVLERISGLNIIVRGVLSPPVIMGQEKTAINILDLSTGETRQLAILNNGKAGGIHTKRWQFDETVLAWGNEILSRSVPCDLLVVDELGPLEFNRNEGFVNGLKAIDSGQFHAALVVVRPSLLESALQRWPGAEVFEVNRQAQAEYVKRIITAIENLVNV